MSLNLVFFSDNPQCQKWLILYTIIFHKTWISLGPKRVSHSSYNNVILTFVQHVTYVSGHHQQAHGNCTFISYMSQLYIFVTL